MNDMINIDNNFELIFKVCNEKKKYSSTILPSLNNYLYVHNYSQSISKTNLEFNIKKKKITVKIQQVAT